MSTGFTASNVLLMPGVAPSNPRKRYTRLTGEAERRLIAELQDLENPGTYDYQRLADRYAVSLRSVERRVAKARNANAPRSVTTGRKCTPLPDDSLVTVAACGQRRLAWQNYRESGAYMCSYSTFTRQLNSQIGSNIVTGAAKGTQGMRQTLSQVLERRPFLNAYSIDLFSLRAPFHIGRGRVITPMGMLVREASTGMIVNEHVFDTENIDAAMIGAVVGQAFRGRSYALADEDGDVRDVFVGGLPDFVYCDNESKLHARTLNALYAGLGVNVLPINSYSSHENGAHERLHGTLRTQVLDLLPNSSRGPRDHRGRPMADGEVPDIALARQLLHAFAYRWNTETATEGPALQRWIDALDAGHEIRRAAPQELARLAHEHPESCQRYSLGVRLLNEHYFCPELTKLPSKRFTVRRWLGDDDHVEIFKIDGTYVGTAVRNGAQTAADSQAVVSHNAEERRIVEAVHAAAGPLREQLLQTIAASAPQPVVTQTFEPAGPDEAAADTEPGDETQATQNGTGEDPPVRDPESDPVNSLTLPPTRRHQATSPDAPDHDEER